MGHLVGRRRLVIAEAAVPWRFQYVLGIPVDLESVWFLGKICLTVRCLNVEELVFSVSDNVVFSTSSSSLRPWAIRAVEAMVSLREGWSSQDTRSVTSLSLRSKSDALDALRDLTEPLEVVTARWNNWYWAAETFFWATFSSSSSVMDLSLTLSSESRAAEKFTGEASLEVNQTMKTFWWANGNVWTL